MPGKTGNRRGLLLLGVAVLALCGVAFAGAAGVASAALASGATMNITYETATTLQVQLGDGTTVTSGSTIPAGSYMVIVYDAQNEDTNPQLSISGPGVSLSSNLNSTGMGIDQPAEFGPFTFATSSSYSVEDTNIGASTLVTFNTSATATASGGSSGSSGGSSGSSGGSSSGGSSSGSGSGGSSSGGSTSTTSGSGSTTTIAGKLAASVSAAGKDALSLDGKPVKTLKAGLYTISVADHSAKAGFIVGKTAASALTLSSAAHVGTSSRNVKLTAGKWFFEPSTHGLKTSFTVSG